MKLRRLAVPFSASVVAAMRSASSMALRSVMSTMVDSTHAAPSYVMGTTDSSTHSSRPCAATRPIS